MHSSHLWFSFTRGPRSRSHGKPHTASCPAFALTYTVQPPPPPTCPPHFRATSRSSARLLRQELKDIEASLGKKLENTERYKQLAVKLKLTQDREADVEAHQAEKERRAAVLADLQLDPDEMRVWRGAHAMQKQQEQKEAKEQEVPPAYGSSASSRVSSWEKSSWERPRSPVRDRSNDKGSRERVRTPSRDQSGDVPGAADSGPPPAYASERRGNSMTALDHRPLKESGRRGSLERITRESAAVSVPGGDLMARSWVRSSLESFDFGKPGAPPPPPLGLPSDLSPLYRSRPDRPFFLEDASPTAGRRCVPRLASGDFGRPVCGDSELEAEAPPAHPDAPPDDAPPEVGRVSSGEDGPPGPKLQPALRPREGFCVTPKHQPEMPGDHKRSGRGPSPRNQQKPKVAKGGPDKPILVKEGGPHGAGGAHAEPLAKGRERRTSSTARRTSGGSTPSTTPSTPSHAACAARLALPKRPDTPVSGPLPSLVNPAALRQRHEECQQILSEMARQEHYYIEGQRDIDAHVARVDRQLGETPDADAQQRLLRERAGLAQERLALQKAHDDVMEHWRGNLKELEPEHEERPLH